jgi:murein DD-endopeptidase MepM/ murein hydrolase activator NlpD
MQLMWVSGPTGKVHTISITARKMLMGAGILAFTFATAGFLLYLVGFKIAVEARPELARSLGGVTTQAEQERMEAVYRGRLTTLQGALDATSQELQQLQTLKNHFMEMATPSSLRDKRSSLENGKGGPFVPTMRVGLKTYQPLSTSIDDTAADFDQLKKIIIELRQDWSKQLSWLQTLPTGTPITGDFRVSSGFGMRTDPFTGTLARHEGLDFTAATGTSILASADGVITRSGWEDTYGNVIEITHAEGYMTRYAHISNRIGKEGQKVKRGELIAEVGSTGRSTGPHLHYEIFRYGQVINPVQVLSISNI